MIIEINKHTTLGEISEQFSKYYPFLKIEFFNDSPHWMEASHSGNLLLKSLCVGDIVSLRHTVLLEFHFWNKTGMVESVFQKKVGLEAQVYRRHGDCWIQTSGTDELTLEEQNSIGKFDSEDVLHGTNRTNKL